jgi:4-amino-4-deoxy-L-arabinose transferase-like glycosyltransferase
LYFQIRPDDWFQPAIVYGTALVLKILPLTEWSVRVPTLLIGLIDIALVYFIAKRVFGSAPPAILAAVLLMLTPAHFIHSRIAMDYLYPVPFTLGWLLCLLRFLERQRPLSLFAATVCLGLGFFSYLASVVMMPIDFVITCVVPFQKAEWRRISYFAVAALGLILPLLLLAWVVKYPQMLTDTLIRYRISDRSAGGPPSAALVGIWRSIRWFLHFQPIARRLAVYWSFVDPGYLFVAGGWNPSGSTSRAGVFLLATAPFLAVGINRIVNRPRTPIEVLLLVGFLVAPLAALIVDDPYAIGRELSAVPFGVLIAVLGVETMWKADPRWRTAAAVLLLSMLVQFGFFYADYHNGYRRRIAYWFGSNLSGAMEQLIASEPPGGNRPIYLNKYIFSVDWYWRFYLAKHHRADLLDRTVYFDPSPAHTLDPESVPTGSLVLSTIDDVREAALTQTGRLRRVSTFYDPDGAAFFGLLQRQ